ncbi:MAG TPA: ATP-grasp domain-containing protein [Kofleriaceae bacterium]
MRVAVVFDTPYRQYGPPDHDRQCALDLVNPKLEPDQEYQLGDALRKRGHEVTFLGIRDDVVDALSWLRDNKVDVVFNAAESFRGRDALDYLVPALLESENVPFTGSPPQALMVTRNKAISKKVLRHHGLSVPDFRTYRQNERVDKDPGLRYPCIVKPLSTDGSMGISQASIVRDLEQLSARVDFVVERWATAIAEEFVEGRELYVGVVGNGDTARYLPILELVFDKDRTAPEERIATVKAKWDDEYRAKMNIRMQLARPLSQKAQERIAHTCRVAYGVLGLRDYGRLDLRVDQDDTVWVLEANANPYLSRDHELAMAAEKGGLSYEELIETIASEAVRRSAEHKP